MSDDILKNAMQKLQELTGGNINLDSLIPKDIYSSIQMMIASLGQQAWVCMGMQANPMTGNIEKDLKQAKVAVDCVTAMTDIIKPHVAEQQKLELETLKQNLQLNLIQKIEDK